MNWTPLDTWIVAIGAVTAASCALLGCFLVLRRMSLMGDAISHAVLPGLAIAFLLTGSRSSWPMFVGAAGVGLVTAILTQSLSRWGRVDESASMGVVFTTLFALGLVLIVQAADRVDLDPGCVLYGAIELAPLDTQRILGFELPRAFVVNLLVLLLNAGVTTLLFKELLFTTFDPALATAMGFRAGAMHQLLMVLVALTTVSAFESVGSILVVAMLVVPAAAAHLLTDRLSTMLIVAALFGAASAALGHVGAITLPGLWGFSDTSTAGMIALAAGGLFVLALLFAPRHGLLSRARVRFALRLRIVKEDVLGCLFRMEELGTAPAHPTPGLVRTLLKESWILLALAVRLLRAQGMLHGWSLTPTGRVRAREVIRTHRLWESYLHQFLGLRPDHLHRASEVLEHVTSPDLRARLAERVSDPAKDPHGHAIPPR